MSGYPIRAVSKLTGLSVDILRAWERRYGAITPERGDRGRTYSEDEVYRLGLLKAAVDRGHAIGQIASLKDEELKALAERSEQLEVGTESLSRAEEAGLAGVLEAVVRYDHVQAERELSRLAVLMSPRELVLQVVSPLLQEVGRGWERGTITVAHEHMVSALLRNLLGSLIRIYGSGHPLSRLLFATPQGELHEFGILGAALMAAGGGLGTLYLGPNLPAEDILEAAHRGQIRAVVLGLKNATPSKEPVEQLIRVARGLPEWVELWVGGELPPEALRHLEGGNRLYLESLDALQRHLRRLGARL